MKREEGLERIDTYSPHARRNITLNFHPAGFTSSCHTHDFYEINYVLGGEMTNEISGVPIRMKTGDAVLLHPGVFHIPSAPPGATVLNILVRPHWLLGALASVGEGALAHFAAAASREDYVEYLLFLGGEGETAVRSLLKEWTDNAPYAPLAVEGRFLALLAVLGRTATVQEAVGRDAGFFRFSGILAYLYENSATATAATLASRFGYSPSHLSRLFRRYTGMTPSAMLIRARLERAAALLRETDATVTAVAAEAGFPCLPYFHRLFRRTFGKTPEEYRRVERGCKNGTDAV